MRQCLIAVLLVAAAPSPQPATEPIVRIGLTQNAATVKIRSERALSVEPRSTRAATFTTVLALDPAATGPLKKADLQYRISVELDGDTILVMPAGARRRREPAA